MATRTSRARRWVAFAAGASLAIPGVGLAGAASAAPVQPVQPVAAGATIDEQLLEQTSDGQKTDAWVRFDARPDMSQFSQIGDWDERGQAVYDSLTAVAQDSQAELRAELDAAGTDYSAFWATNSIRISGVDAETLTDLAATNGVEGIYPTFQVEEPVIEEGTAQRAPNAVEWGVADINAPAVWDQGFTGEGIVIASIDTGAQWDHPALIDQYRGTAADGTVDHNYNWFDAAGTSPDAPADNNGHGTHVTGTMVGTDGGDNEIGVAPGATWIAANGCCPTDEALVSSGEWMIAPTDLNGENPRPDLRPHIINNSWGTTAPSNDPFMEDIFDTWTAAGQFGVFANGNSGSLGCASSGAPGSLVSTYSVGNYNSGHTISNTSGRGPGEDGEVKPNIAAPGSNVRSAWPGSGYNAISGTSMASPHVAGAVALIWSASPTIHGDYEATRALFDGTAIDTEDLQCGGTAEKNNVFGEGRTDVLAALNEAPIGPSGTLAGTVTDGSTDEPIGGATVEVSGDEVDRTLTTNADGEFSATLGEGDYELTGSAFGYLSATVEATVTEDETSTVNLALEPADSGVVSGTVTDGSGYGFPLYAEVSVQGQSLATYTDPVTGDYSMELPSGSTYTLEVIVQYPGYTTPSVEVEITGDVTEDFAVPVDVLSCAAPGYEFLVEGVTETFDTEELPDGWAVVDHLGSGQVWQFDDPGDRGNLTGGEGGFAIQDSDFHGSGGQQDTSLVSPSADMSALTNPVVGFKQDYRPLGDNADVEVSIDGGTTWETVLAQTAAARGPREDIVPLPTAAGESDVQVRFHHYNVDWDWWWQVDDVFLGNRDCVPAGDGGYVVGNVYSGDDGVVGADVVNLDHEDQAATTTATPSDDNLDDGFYWIFSDTPGTNSFEASAAQHGAVVEEVTVAHGETVRQDFALSSGHIEVNPAEVEHAQEADTIETTELTLSNTGGADTTVTLRETEGDFEPAATGAGAPVVSNEVETSVAAAGAALASEQPASAGPNDEWEALPDHPRTTMDNRVVNVDGDYYSITGTTGTAAFTDVNKFDSDAGTWEAVAPLPEAASATNAVATSDTIVVSGGWVDGGVSTSTHLYDVATDTWTSGAPAPAGVSASGVALLDGVMYVVAGCTTADCSPMGTSVMSYDIDGDSWETLGNYPDSAAFLACGVAADELVCSGGNAGAGGTAASYAYDAGADSWSPIADAPADHWAANYAAANDMLVVSGGVQGPGVTNNTFAWNGEEWTTDVPNPTHPVYRGGMACGIGKVGGSSGGFTPIANTEHLPGWECPSLVDVPWLTAEPMEVDVPAGGTATVTVTTDSTGLADGTYTAGLEVRADTPQGPITVPVTMTVGPLAGVIEISPTSVSHEVEFGGSDSTDVAFANTGDAGAEVSLAAAEETGWLSINPDAFTVDAGESVNVAVGTDAAGLEAGTYSAAIEVTADTGQDLADISVTLVVAEEPVPPVGVIEISPTSVSHEVEFGGSDSTDVAFANTGDAGAEVSLAAAEETGWLSIDPDAFTVDAGESVNVAVGTDAAGLEAGTYSAAIEVTADTGQDLADISVTLVVAEEAPTPPIEIDRVQGADRYGTAVAVSQAHDEGVPLVLLATGTDYPDALTGSALAASEDIPVLLTRPDHLPQVTAGELERLQPERVIVLGGPIAISDEVVQEAGAAAGVTPERLFGANRYETAAEVAAAFGTFGPASGEVFVATGTEYADALTAAARAGMLDSPVLLVRGDRVPAATAAALDALNPSQITVLGGPVRIDDSVVDRLADWGSVERLFGDDRYHTAQVLAQEWAEVDTVYLTSGQDWPDALAGSARAGSQQVPMLLTRPDLLPAITGTALVDLGVDHVVVLGGELAVSEDVLDQIRELPRD